jgi:hypothetical protein
VDLRQKYNYDELSYEALEDNLEQASKIESTKIVKVDASISCDDLPNELVYTTIEKSATNPSLENASCSIRGKKEWIYLERLEREHKSLNQLYNLHQEQIIELDTREKELKEQVETLESSMKKLTRG